MGRAKKEAMREDSFLKGAIKHPGALKKSLHIPMCDKIPAQKLDKAMHSKNPTMKKRAVLANTMKNFHKTGK